MKRFIIQNFMPALFFLTWIFIFQLLLLDTKAFAIQNESDSIQQARSVAAPDSLKLSILTNLAEKYLFKDMNLALKYSNEALEIAKKNGDINLIAKQYRHLGRIYWKNLLFEKAFETHFLVMKIYEASGNKKGIASTYNSIGTVYRSQGNLLQNAGDLEKGAEYILNALNIAREIGDSSDLRVYTVNAGNAHKDIGKEEEAIKYYSECLMLSELEQEELIKNGIKEKVSNYGIDRAKIGLGQTYLQLANKTSSVSHYAKANEYFKTIVWFKQEAMMGMGEIYLRQGNYDMAINVLAGALAISNNKEMFTIRQQITYLLSDAYEKKKNMGEAFKYFKLYAAFKDTLIKQNNQQHINRLLITYDTEKKEKEIKLLNTETELQSATVNRQQIIIWSAGAGMILLLTLAIVILFGYYQKRKANSALTEKNTMIEKQRNNILDSINYAKRIQESMLMREAEIHRIWPFETFIFFRPKDIVSGDFYWFSKQENKYLFAAVDCTGHGVPGGFMSMLANSFLNEIVNKMKVTCPSEILNNLNKLIRDTLQQAKDESRSQDGMDVAICSIDLENKTLEYAGARNPLYFIDPSINQGKINVIKGDPFTLGGKNTGNMFSTANPSPVEPAHDGVLGNEEKNQNSLQEAARSYTNHVLPLVDGMIIYLFSDGYLSQHGGPSRKTLGSRQFREWLFKHSTSNLLEQKVLLADEIDKWKGVNGQTDDMIIVGVKI